MDLPKGVLPDRAEARRVLDIPAGAGDRADFGWGADPIAELSAAQN